MIGSFLIAAASSPSDGEEHGNVCNGVAFGDRRARLRKIHRAQRKMVVKRMMMEKIAMKKKNLRPFMWRVGSSVSGSKLQSNGLPVWDDMRSVVVWGNCYGGCGGEM
ncbi:unnamed protein product [Lathyrus oleraceus]